MSKRIDYDSIEADWRAGVKSPEQIVSEYNDRTGESITRPAILKHFKIAGIPRDLTKKIQASADRKVQLAQTKVTELQEKLQRKLSETELVDATASTQADIRTEHTAKATENRKILETMIQELSAQNEYREALSKLGELMVSDASFDKLNELYHKIISFGGRVDSAKKLMESWAKIVDTERKVYGIANDNPIGEEIKEIVRRIVEP